MDGFTTTSGDPPPCFKFLLPKFMTSETGVDAFSLYSIDYSRGIVIQLLELHLLFSNNSSQFATWARKIVFFGSIYVMTCKHFTILFLTPVIQSEAAAAPPHLVVLLPHRILNSEPLTGLTVQGPCKAISGHAGYHLEGASKVAQSPSCKLLSFLCFLRTFRTWAPQRPTSLLECSMDLVQQPPLANWAVGEVLTPQCHQKVQVHS